MTKSIFLNAKIDEITKINEMKNKYRDVADIRIKKTVTLINMIVDNKKMNEKIMQLITIEKNKYAK